MSHKRARSPRIAAPTRRGAPAPQPGWGGAKAERGRGRQARGGPGARLHPCRPRKGAGPGLRAAAQSEPPPRAHSRPRPGPDKESALRFSAPRPHPPGRAPVLYFVLLPKRVNNKSFGFFFFFLMKPATCFPRRGRWRRGGRPGGWGKRQGLGHPAFRQGPRLSFSVPFI